MRSDRSSPSHENSLLPSSSTFLRSGSWQGHDHGVESLFEFTDRKSVPFSPPIFPGIAEPFLLAIELRLATFHQNDDGSCSLNQLNVYSAGFPKKKIRGVFRVNEISMGQYNFFPPSVTSAQSGNSLPWQVFAKIFAQGKIVVPSRRWTHTPLSFTSTSFPIMS